MIMDYLVKHGYPQAASDFAREAGLNLNVTIDTIERRKKIKNAIYAGQLQIAIEEINEINPDVSCPKFSCFIAMIIWYHAPLIAFGH